MRLDAMIRFRSLHLQGFTFAFFNPTEESSKLRQRWAEVNNLVGKGFRRDVLLGVDHCREIVNLT